MIDDLGHRFGALPQGRWRTPPGQAVILSLAAPGQPEPYGFLVAGVSPMRILDERYRRMFRLTVDQIEAAIGAARAFEEERTRVEALAALDRAKTGFFSNVSHEFRTPLTLMLGPLSDLLAACTAPLPPAQRAQLELVHRNAIRLHKLVEHAARHHAHRGGPHAGRLRAGGPRRPDARARRVVPFRRSSAPACACGRLPAARRAGLRRSRHVGEDRPQPALERVQVHVRGGDHGLAARGRRCRRAAVADTGVGIAAEELPQLFDRFYRVEGTRARTHEGSGSGWPSSRSW